MMLLPSALLCLLSFLLSFLPASSARQINVTIDDQDGDPTNGNHIIYSPSGGWSTGQNCSGCQAKVTPRADAYLGTWMDATYFPDRNPGEISQASVNFVGSAVYIICILTGSTQPDANTDMTFVLDGVNAGSYEKRPDGNSTYLFNQIVFSATGLSNDSHTLQLLSGLAGQQALVLLDAVMYTKDDGSGDGDGDGPIAPSSTSAGSSAVPSTQRAAAGAHDSHAGVIVGAVIAGLSVLPLLGGLCFYLRRRRRRKDAFAPPARDPGVELRGPHLALDRDEPEMLMSMTAASSVATTYPYASQPMDLPAGVLQYQTAHAWTGYAASHAGETPLSDFPPAYNSIEWAGGYDAGRGSVFAGLGESDDHGLATVGTAPGILRPSLAGKQVADESFEVATSTSALA